MKTTQHVPGSHNDAGEGDVHCAAPSPAARRCKVCHNAMQIVERVEAMGELRVRRYRATCKNGCSEAEWFRREEVFL